MENCEDTEYIYSAFVSHSHRDVKWAEWIWKALEHYRLPSNVRKRSQRPLPKRLKAFLDTADLGVDNLENGLYKELKASRFLVVLCSPESAKPNAQGTHYVETEVRRFEEMGRKDQIIPVIISGTAETAFCPTLKRLNIKAVDATQLSRSRALNDIVAKILGLRPDELWRRWERQQRAKHFWHALIAIFSSVASIGSALFYWDNTREVQECYASTVDDYGILRGVHKLSELECSRSSHFYKFVYKGLKFGRWCHADSSTHSLFRFLGCKRILRKMVVFPSNGLDHIEGTPEVLTFHYDMDGGRADEVSCRSASGRFVRREILSNDHNVINGLVQYRLESMSKAAYVESYSSHQFLDSHSEVSQFLIDRDGRGAAIRTRYLDTFGNFVCDKNGVWGTECGYDEDGYETETWNIGRSGQRIADKNGVACVKWVRDQKGRGFLRITLDERCNPVPSIGGVSAYRFSHDDYGNVTEIRSVDEDLNPVSDNNGVYITKYENDPHGNIIRQVFCGEDGTPIIRADGVSQVAYTYDNKSRFREVRSYDEHGAGVISTKEQMAGVRFWYNEKNQIVRKQILGCDGRPRKNSSGFAEERTIYDINGNPCETSYYDEEGNPACDDNGSSRICKVYDGGKLVTEKYYGTNGLLKCKLKGGYAIARFKYDDYRGNRTEERYYDELDRPSGECQFSVHAILWKYDDRGLLEEESYLGTNNLPIAAVRGAVRNVFTNDDHGRRKAERGYDARGVLVEDKDGSVGWDHAFDMAGNLVREVWIGCDGLPHDSPQKGFAEIRSEFDDYGNCTNKSYFGADGKPVLNIYGWHEIERKYDSRSKVVEESYWGVRHQPVAVLVDDEYCAKRSASYDRFGNISSQWFFTTDDVVNNSITGSVGYAYSYDVNGNITRRDKLVGHHDVEFFEYDEQGRLSCRRMRDSLGNPLANVHGYTREERKYWENTGAIKERIFTDERAGGVMRENVLLGNCSIAKTIRVFDANGNEGKMSAYDQAGAAIHLTNVVIIASIFQGGQLASKHLSDKSIICEFGQYNINHPSDFDSLDKAIKSQKEGSSAGILVVGNVKQLGIEVSEIILKPGQMGARIADAPIPTFRYQQIKDAFNAFMRNKHK